MNAKNKNTERELSDEELELVSGGGIIVSQARRAPFNPQPDPPGAIGPEI